MRCLLVFITHYYSYLLLISIPILLISSHTIQFSHVTHQYLYQYSGFTHHLRSYYYLFVRTHPYYYALVRTHMITHQYLHVYAIKLLIITHYYSVLLIITHQYLSQYQSSTHNPCSYLVRTNTITHQYWYHYSLYYESLVLLSTPIIYWDVGGWGRDPRKQKDFCTTVKKRQKQKISWALDVGVCYIMSGTRFPYYISFSTI